MMPVNLNTEFVTKKKGLSIRFVYLNGARLLGGSADAKTEREEGTIPPKEGRDQIRGEGATPCRHWRKRCAGGREKRKKALQKKKDSPKKHAAA